MEDIKEWNGQIRVMCDKFKIKKRENSDLFEIYIIYILVYEMNASRYDLTKNFFSFNFECDVADICFVFCIHTLFTVLIISANVQKQLKRMKKTILKERKKAKLKQN